MENSSGLFRLPDVVAVWRKIENVSIMGRSSSIAKVKR